ncbi:hypothetical protein SAY87_013156 [Trapa incisa]|uniref:Negatively light-regulated protein n=1 Tax=Trapa incisa TaxID=236973 RepID=A0AAN7KFW2_9MYRT|nr:hypothetical protein SAY87_013156 [Trapa incisa]
MSGTVDAEVLKDQELVNDAVEDKESNASIYVKELEKDGKGNDGNSISSSLQEEDIIKKKYGGLLRKKPPLISKDHEHAFFDSADWALGKGAGKSRGPLEVLRPKLQPTPHQQARRSAYAPGDIQESMRDDEPSDEAPEDSCCKQDEANDKIITSEEQQKCHVQMQDA